VQRILALCLYLCNFAWEPHHERAAECPAQSNIRCRHNFVPAVCERQSLGKGDVGIGLGSGNAVVRHMGTDTERMRVFADGMSAGGDVLEGQLVGVCSYNVSDMGGDLFVGDLGIFAEQGAARGRDAGINLRFAQ